MRILSLLPVLLAIFVGYGSWQQYDTLTSIIMTVTSYPFAVIGLKVGVAVSNFIKPDVVFGSNNSELVAQKIWWLILLPGAFCCGAGLFGSATIVAIVHHIF